MVLGPCWGGLWLSNITVVFSSIQVSVSVRWGKNFIQIILRVLSVSNFSTKELSRNIATMPTASLVILSSLVSHTQYLSMYWLEIAFRILYAFFCFKLLIIFLFNNFSTLNI